MTLDETIFDHNPTNAEIKAFTWGMPKKKYLSKSNKRLLVADIAIMYADRGDEETSNKYWSLVPDLHKEFMLGIDDIALPIEK